MMESVKKSKLRLALELQLKESKTLKRFKIEENHD